MTVPARENGAHAEGLPLPEPASLEACEQATDLTWRLSQIPPEATCRGAFFNMLDDRAGALSLETQAEYRRFFRIHRYASFRMFPLSDYLTRLVVLAQIHYGKDAIYSGVRRLQSGAFDAWADTLLGKAALAVVDPSLGSMLRMLERAYASRTVVSNARFRVVSETATEIVTEIDEEYVYIEHAMVGAIEGVARVCGVDVTVRAELSGPFDGILRIEIHGNRGPER
ncbi:MAG: DUF2378 family protein [Deltaproteobacteria bacterium]|nr:DUF2378 family protein [Deltaproteobacteria bacterium]